MKRLKVSGILAWQSEITLVANVQFSCKISPLTWAAGPMMVDSSLSEALHRDCPSVGVVPAPCTLSLLVSTLNLVT